MSLSYCSNLKNYKFNYLLFFFFLSTVNLIASRSNNALPIETILVKEQIMTTFINIFTNNYSSLIGRIFISAIFLMAGLNKISNYEGTLGYMNAMGVPSFLLPLVIATEVLGSLAIILGYKTRLVAFLLAGFSIISALLFHLNFSDQMQSIMFMKNIAIAGGFLFLVANGAGYVSIDNGMPKTNNL